MPVGLASRHALALACGAQRGGMAWCARTSAIGSPHPPSDSSTPVALPQATRHATNPFRSGVKGARPRTGGGAPARGSAPTSSARPLARPAALGLPQRRSARRRCARVRLAASAHRRDPLLIGPAPAAARGKSACAAGSGAGPDRRHQAGDRTCRGTRFRQGRRRASPGAGRRASARAGSATPRVSGQVLRSRGAPRRLGGSS